MRRGNGAPRFNEARDLHAKREVNAVLCANQSITMPIHISYPATFRPDEQLCS